MGWPKAEDGKIHDVDATDADHETGEFVRFVDGNTFEVKPARMPTEEEIREYLKYKPPIFLVSPEMKRFLEMGGL